MWSLTTEQKVNEDGVAYTAYGFICGDHHIRDFSSVREEAERFIESLNRSEVAPVHIYDVIEDYFGAL